MSVTNISKLVSQMKKAGFSKVVITGGEPLMHNQHESMLNSLSDLRSAVKPMKIVLRTNLAYSITPSKIMKLLFAV